MVLPLHCRHRRILHNAIQSHWPTFCAQQFAVASCLGKCENSSSSLLRLSTYDWKIQRASSRSSAQLNIPLRSSPCPAQNYLRDLIENRIYKQRPGANSLSSCLDALDASRLPIVLSFGHIKTLECVLVCVCPHCNP